MLTIMLNKEKKDQQFKNLSKNKNISLATSLLIVFFLFFFSSQATTYFAKTSGNWNVAANWVTDVCGGATNSTGLYPGAGDDVVICPGKSMTVNVNITINNLTIQGNGGNGTANNGTLFINSTITLTVSGNLVFDNINNSSSTYCLQGVNSSSICSVTGNFIVNSNCTYAGIRGGGWQITFRVGGTTTINGALYFILGTICTFTGDVIINSPGGVWNASGTGSSPSFTFGGSLTNNNTFISSGPPYTFSGLGNIGGTNAVIFNTNLTINGTYTNTGTLTIASGGSDLLGTGSLTQGVGSTLNIIHSCSINYLDASAVPNTVNYNYNNYGAVVKGAAYYDLNLTGSGSTTFISGPITVNNNLFISSGANLRGNQGTPSVGFTHTVSGITTINGTLACNYDSDIWNLNGDVTLNGGTLGGCSSCASPYGTINIGGTFTVASSTSYIGAGTMNFYGISNINAALNMANFYTGIKTFTGLVTIGSSGSWTTGTGLTVGTAIFQGGITVVSGGTFNHNPRVKFNQNNQSLNGTMTFGMGDSVNVITVTNNGNVSCLLLNLAGSGSWVQGINSTLNIAGFITVSSFDATANGNTVNYTCTGTSYQDIRLGTGNTYYNLTLSGAMTGGWGKCFVGNTIITNDFLISGGSICSEDGTFGGGANIINVGGTTTITGASTMRIQGNAAAKFITQNLIMNGGTINNLTNTSALLTVNNNFTVNSGTTNTIDKTPFIMNSVSGNSIINGANNSIVNGTLTISNSGAAINAACTFNGNLSVPSTGIVTVTQFITTGTFSFKNGLNVDGSFNGTKVTFGTNDQIISGNSGNITFSDIVTCASSKTVTNNHPNINMTSTASGVLAAGSGTWAQGTGTLHYWGSTILVTNFSASSAGNTVDYAGNVAQAIRNPNAGTAGTYCNLSVTNSNTKTIGFANAVIHGNLLIANSAVLAVAANNFSIAGNWTNNSSAGTPFSYSGAQIVTFNGGCPQIVSGTTGSIFNNLTMNGTGGLTINTAALINGNLQLTNGIINSIPSLLTLGNSATWSSGGNSSYVDGPLRKTGITSGFIFPMGSGGIWARIEVSGISSSSDFQTQYFRANPINSTNSTIVSPLDHISSLEYWELNKTGGTSSAYVTLYTENALINSGGISNCSNISVAHFNTILSQWENAGGTGTGPSCPFPGTSAVTVTSDLLSSFSPFTFGSKFDDFSLPVTWLSFNAVKNENSVELKWITASEYNNNFFNVERSKDGNNFEDIAKIKASGNSSNTNEYLFVDQKPYKGISYYRIKQTDLNGKYTYSQTLSVNFEGLEIIELYPNPTSNSLNLQINSPADTYIYISIYNTSGQNVLSEKSFVKKGLVMLSYNISSLNPMIYFLKAVTEDNKYSNEITFIKSNY